MAKQSEKQRFEAILAKWREAAAISEKLRIDLRCKYGECSRYHWKAADRNKMEKLESAADKACEKFLAMLRDISPRNWQSVVPVYWIRENVTYAMAKSSDSIECPPASYGYSDKDAKQWSAAIDTK